MRAVIDASVGIPIIHEQDVSRAVTGWVARWVAAGSGLVVPAHFWLEVVNSLAHRHRYRGDAILEAVAELRALEIETIELDEAALVLVLDVTERHGLSAYDAQYLALALQLGLPLVTIDRRLAAAAGARAIDPLEGRRVSETAATYATPRTPTWPDYAGAASYFASLRARVAGSAAKPGAGSMPQ